MQVDNLSSSHTSQKLPVHGGYDDMRFGSGSFIYEVEENWAKVPEGWDLMEIPGIAVDSQDHIFAFTRSERPLVAFDRAGNFLTTWGQDIFTRAHGIFIGQDGLLYCVDEGDHTMRKCTPEGKVLMTLGTPGQPSDTGCLPRDYLSVKRPGPPFNRPTSVALSPEGDIYVTDGYCNCRVHKFSPDGRLLMSWGEPGVGPGQFHLVHGVCVDPDGIVYVGDRMNSRVQVFSPTGEFITQWNDTYQPNDLYLDGEGHLFIAEIGYRADLPMTGPLPAPEDSYSRVTIRNLKGEILASVTNSDPKAPGGFLSAHGVRVDSHGDLYVSEVSATRAKNQGKNRHDFHIIQKFRRCRG